MLGERAFQQDADGKHDAGGEDADAYPIVPEAPVEETGKRDGEQGEQQIVAHGPSVGMGTLPGGVVCLGPFLAGVGDDAYCPCLRRLNWWIICGKFSFPTPLSPVIDTDKSVGAT